MSKNLTVAFGLFFGAASLGIMAPAQASLTGQVSINPQVGGGVILEGTGLKGRDNDPLTNLDFTPPATQPSGGPFTGGVVEINAPSDSDFKDFIGWQGTFKDLIVPKSACVPPVCKTNGAIFPDFPLGGGATSGPVLEFARIDKKGPPGTGNGLGGFIFNLLDVSFPVYTESITPSGAKSTTVSIAGVVEARKLDLNGNITSDPPSSGPGNISADFPGLSADDVRDLFDVAGEIPKDSNGDPIQYSWSSAWTLGKVPPSVPESSNTVGLIVLGLAGATLMTRRKLQKK